MRSLLAAAALLASAALASACATTSGSGGGGGPETEGQRLYRQHCGSCHRLRNPADYTQAKWAWALRKFGDRAHLPQEQRPLVLAYLQEHAKDAPPPTTTTTTPPAAEAR
jgi:mono/diheme cytochrome c family protein